MKESEVVQYLLNHDLIDMAAIVDGELRIIDQSRRNWNFRIECESGRSYLLKKSALSDDFASPTREAFVYEAMLSAPGLRKITKFLPNVYFRDQVEDLLILELLIDAEDLRQYHRRRGRFPRSIASQIGQAYGEFHALAPMFNRPHLNHLLIAHEPVGFYLDRPGLPLLYDFSTAAIELVRLIQQSPEICQVLQAVRREWQATAFIQLDARWDNVLVTKPSRKASRVVIIDWEAAGLGDPAWDLGGIFGDYLACWISSIPVNSHVVPESYLQFAEYPLDSIQPALRACWQSYVQTAGLDDAEAIELLLRTARYTGIKLMQTSLEHVQRSSEYDMTAVCLLQVGANVLMLPRAAIENLFGIRCE